MPLDPKFKAEWCENLRSGVFIQGKRMLCDGSKYCCLGVACVILDPQRKSRWRNEHSGMPESLAFRVGLTGSVQARLAHMNDDTEMGFPEIADYIEKCL